MSYFDDNEDRIINGRSSGHRPSSRRGLSAEPGSALASARQAAHRAFDPTWQSGGMSRTKAYKQLAKQLGIPVHDCHMLYFDVETCERVVALYLIDDFEVLP